MNIKENVSANFNAGIEILENIPIGIGIYQLHTDKTLTTEYINPYRASMAGFTVSEYLNYTKNNIHAMVIKEDIPLIKNQFNITDMNEIGCSYRIETKNNTIIWVRFTAKVISISDCITRYYCVFENITKHLENKEQQLTLQLSTALRNAEKANNAKSEFLSNMSHDIRTPMNIILGMTAIARDVPENPEETLDCLNKISISGDYLLSIINDSLDMSKIETSAVELCMEPYLLDDFVAQINTMIRPLCNEKHIEFIFEADDISIKYVFMDKKRFNQIFLNLLSNSVKYTPEYGKIEFIVEHIKRHGNFMHKRFTIRDNGIGMSKEFQEHMFEPFSRENNLFVSNQQGTGLGLAIVKNLVKLMDGTISVISEEGKGTEFIIEMETEICNNVPESVPKETETFEDVLSGTNVLLCEDHPMNREIVKKLLEKKGVIVSCARNGQSGVNIFNSTTEGRFDAILMDIRMPLMDGLQATRLIRSLNRSDSKTVPIIAFTANVFAADITKAKDAGMNTYLAKPVDPEKMYRTLRNAINCRHSH